MQRWNKDPTTTWNYTSESRRMRQRDQAIYKIDGRLNQKRPREKTDKSMNLDSICCRNLSNKPHVYTIYFWWPFSFRAFRFSATLLSMARKKQAKIEILARIWFIHFQIDIPIFIYIYILRMFIYVYTCIHLYQVEHEFQKCPEWYGNDWARFTFCAKKKKLNKTKCE